MSIIESIITIFLCVLEIKPILKKNLKTSWIIFMLRAFIRSGRLLKKTRWGKRKDAEAKYAKSLILLPAIYLNLKDLFANTQAYTIMTEIVYRLSHAIDYAVARKNLLFTIKDPFQRWLKYRSILITDDIGLHNKIEDVYINKTRMHYIVTRCIFHDVFTETGVPELTPIVCDYDQTYHSALFSEFYFDRNGSPKNTIGYGAPVCHYVWKDKEALSREFRQFLEEEQNKEYTPGEERRRFLRRQFDRRQHERRQFERRTDERRTH